MGSHTLHDYLKWNARYHAERAALIIDDQPTTYLELARATGILVSQLTQHGVSAGDRVAVWLPNSQEWISLFLACSAIGAVAIPLNTRLSAPEVKSIIEKATPKVLATQKVYRKKRLLEEAVSIAESISSPLAIIEATGGGAFEWRQATNSHASEGLPVSIADLLAVKFTSGTSTGQPKGVMLTNDHFIRAASYASRCLQMTPTSSLISHGPFYHTSGSMHCISACLITASTLVSLPSWDPDLFLETAAKHRCTVTHAPHYTDLFDLDASKVREKLATISRATVGALSAQHISEIVHTFGIEGAATLYGMTETCGNLTMWYPDDPLESRVSRCGRPAPWNEIRIAGSDDQPVKSPGDIGEIQMRGPGITFGYYNDPELTNKSFTADGWFKSGDSGTLNDRSQLGFSSRIKDIIRVGGENLTPQEVEQVLMATGHFESVCVCGIPDQRLSEIPIAVVIPKPDSANRIPDAMAVARGLLASFKIPRKVFIASELPYTDATKKIQRNVVVTNLLSGNYKEI